MVPGSTIQRYDNVTDACANYVAVVNGYTQRPVVRFGYCAAPSLPFVYYWKPGLYLNDSNAQNVTAYVPNSETFYVYTHGRNNCLVRDSVPIIVPIHHVFVYPLDTSICLGESVKLHARGAGAGGSGGYQWFENDFNTVATSLDDPTSADPLAHPSQTTTYYVIFNDQYAGGVDCMDTLSLVVNVFTLPPVKIVNNDTVITFGQVVNLMANGAYTYSWTPSGTLSDPNIPNPVANPTQSTRYVVFGIDRNGCQSTDTVQVNVNQRNGLMVPSGFTPNNDGVNDQFKVVGLTFEKVMEFRVFNRWGQEIFSTTDGTKGWDGRWKGVPQDIGTYSYIIRIGFPDGYVETYKGEVTLIK
jgi:gliding motility-associated-like protein